MLKHNTIGKGTKHRAVNGGNDAYFTKPKIALRYIKRALRKTHDLDIKCLIEPSAGDGAFLQDCHDLPIFAYDIHPKTSNIEKADWFDVEVPKNSLVIGNPPFGFASSLAVKFFNHAATGATAIAFIVPQTFKKISVQNRLNPYFYLISNIDCPKNTFTVDGNDYHVPSVFQIWVRRDKKRKLIKNKSNKWIEFTTKDKAEFALRRVGGKSGQVLEGVNYSNSSTYFCKEKIPGAKCALQNIDFTKIINSTAGVRSLSKLEIHNELKRYYRSSTKDSIKFQNSK